MKIDFENISLFTNSIRIKRRTSGIKKTIHSKLIKIYIVFREFIKF